MPATGSLGGNQVYQTPATGGSSPQGGQYPTQQTQQTPQWGQSAQAVGGFQSPGYQFGMGPSGPIQGSVEGQQLNTQGYQPYNPNANFQGNAGLDTSRIGAAQMPVSSVGAGQPYYDRMQDAYYQQGESRLKPRMQEEQASLETQLQNQGLTRGSSAWNSEMDRQMRSRNDAYSGLTNQAIMASGQEAARMQGMDINAGNFANQAAQQNFMNQGQSQNWFNQANQQNWQNQNLAQQQSNAAGQQGWQNQLTGQEAQNAAMGQQFNQNLAQGNFANQAQQQGFNNDLARANLNNSAYGQMRQQDLAQQQANSQLQASYANTAAQQQNYQNQFDLATRGMDFEQAVQMQRQPYELQNLQMQGMYPGQMPQMPGTGSVPGLPQSPNYINAGGQQNAVDNYNNSLGGNLLNAGMNLFSNYWK